MGGRRVRVFHISDLHMRSVEGPQAEPQRLEAAYHPTDYPRACELLKQACATLGVPLDRLFVIPGSGGIAARAAGGSTRTAA